jgi:hypothetical protein
MDKVQKMILFAIIVLIYGSYGTIIIYIADKNGIR